MLVKKIIEACLKGEIDVAYDGRPSGASLLVFVFSSLRCPTSSFFCFLGIWELHTMGYAAVDIISVIFRIVKNYDMAEFLKLEYVREIGKTHMRILSGVDSLIQLTALAARLCRYGIEGEFER